MFSKVTKVLFVCLTTFLVVYGSNIAFSDSCPKVKPASGRCIADMAAEFGSCSPTSEGVACKFRNIATNHSGNFTSTPNGDNETNVTVDGLAADVKCTTVYWCHLDEHVCVKNETGIPHGTKPLKQVTCP